MRFEIEIHRSPGLPTVPRFEAPAGWLTFSADEDNFAAFELETRTGYMSIGPAPCSMKPDFVIIGWRRWC